MKQKKPSRVVLEPVMLETICHNKQCRRKMKGPNKILEGFPNGYVASICIPCYIILSKKGFSYNGVSYTNKGVPIL